MSRPAYDAVVIGSGPNGLAAAIEIARAGRSVKVIEANDAPGGGTRSEELTLPGYVHDTCSAIHPLLSVSEFFNTIPLERLGIELAHPEIPYAHPLDGGRIAVLHRSVELTAQGLGSDANAYARLMGPLAKNCQEIMDMFLGPIQLPKRPALMIGFGLRAIRSIKGLGSRFDTDEGRVLLAGAAAHSMLKTSQVGTAGFGLGLAMTAHAVGWPCVVGGSGRISEGLVAYLRELGGELELEHRVTSMAELPDARAYVFDTSARELASIAGDALSARYRRAIRRFRYGLGVFKLDWALSEPVPWAAPEARKAGTLHLAGTVEEMAAAEASVRQGRAPDRPYVLFAQQSVFDASRAPAGGHTAWAYSHVPAGSTLDMTQRMEDQIERFAPGFRDVIVERRTMSPADVEAHNSNYIGGDINSGVQDIRQLFTRPTWRPRPYLTSNPNVYICSSATPPGGGVHGMCGLHAARLVLRRSLGVSAKQAEVAKKSRRIA
ncbi:MAG: FAD-dependent oxidoreductase [Actinobacteria bacterium]|nr:FAD-dependent oxidoreductase [Actinomycetota bacterium]